MIFPHHLITKLQCYYNFVHVENSAHQLNNDRRKSTFQKEKFVNFMKADSEGKRY